MPPNNIDSQTRYHGYSIKVLAVLRCCVRMFTVLSIPFHSVRFAVLLICYSTPGFDKKNQKLCRRLDVFAITYVDFLASDLELDLPNCAIMPESEHSTFG